MSMRSELVALNAPALEPPLCVGTALAAVAFFSTLINIWKGRQEGRDRRMLPSSSLRSEQSGSPSHRHDNRTQRPVPQRNWSAVHMDVAAGNTHTHLLYSFLDKVILCRAHTRSVSVMKAATHCSSSRLIGRHSRIRRHNLQPALMHIPLLHMNSTDLQGCIVLLPVFSHYLGLFG
ncbi:hypothetical protein F7725_026648 [Dissostichus mawsoni]|uniref:Uncharacterized protein n=1 Tax=Dissostichus mawsoni TaxID=36200 RepID=A0A7J5X817_DISMA|nr:hypothetical protein F7725_026648 [Dissostichus mawsoni]